VLPVDTGGLWPGAFVKPAMQIGKVGSPGTWWRSFVSRLAALPSGGVSVGRDREAVTGERARRRAARELIGAYHEEQLRGLLEHVREGFARLDRGEIDAFELDELIHRYKRSARELWSSARPRAQTGSAPSGCSYSCAKTAAVLLLIAEAVDKGFVVGGCPTNCA
jgi:hypothetical protein